MPRLSYDALLNSPHLYVLTLRWGGLVYRLAAVPAEFESADGPVQVLDGLSELEWDDGLELLSTEVPEGAISVDVVLPGVDVAALIQAGHDLGQATAEVARLVEGIAWEERHVLMEGDVREPMYGAEGEPLAFSVESVIYTDRTVIPGPDARVNNGGGRTWPDAPEDAVGEVYPLVFGSPGVVGASRLAGSPGVVVDTQAEEDGIPLGREILIAGHHVAAQHVCVAHESNPDTWALLAVRQRTDGHDAPVSTVILHGDEGLADEDDGYWIAWQGEDDAATEGLYERRRSRGIRTAGELVDYMLDLTQMRVDQGRMDAAGALLEQFRLSGYINKRVNVWDWVRTNLLPILPISIHSGPEGLYPVVWRYDATAAQAVEHLSADRLEVVRTQAIRYTDRADVANQLTVEWAYDARRRVYTRTALATGRELPRRAGDVGPEISTHRLRVSHGRYGLRALDPVQTWCVYDAPTAAAILAWLEAKHALPSRMLEYEGGPELWHLEPGDVVTVTDSEVALDRQVCIVTEQRDRDGRCGLVLRTIEDPSRVQ